MNWCGVNRHWWSSGGHVKQLRLSFLSFIIPNSLAIEQQYYLWFNLHIMSAADLGRRLLKTSVEKNLGEVSLTDISRWSIWCLNSPGAVTISQGLIPGTRRSWVHFNFNAALHIPCQLLRTYFMVTPIQTLEALRIINHRRHKSSQSSSYAQRNLGPERRNFSTW